MRCNVTLKPPHILTVEDQQHTLSQGEFNVLMELMLRPMCSLDVLLDVVYPPCAVRPLSERGVVYTHLYWLRRRLKGHCQIINSHRTGWQLIRENDDGTATR